MYDKRYDGRGWNELRQIKAEAGVIKNAVGSAYFEIGKTKCYAAVYGPKSLYPKFLQNPKRAKLRCFYNMMAFSGMGNRVRPGGNRRSKELSMVIQKALEPVVDLSEFPNSVVDVFIEFTSTDAGSRCAGICAASIALADAGIPMTDLVCAVAVGKVDDKIVVDLTYDEEAYEDGPVADVPIAILPGTKQISLLQMDGEITREELLKGVEAAQGVVDRIYEVQKNALKNKFDRGN